MEDLIAALLVALFVSGAMLAAMFIRDFAQHVIGD
jgi:hypothetical protein